MKVSEEPWGRGIRLEDVWIDEYETWEPHVQAFKHDDGSLSLRFCYWKKKDMVIEADSLIQQCLYMMKHWKNSETKLRNLKQMLSLSYSKRLQSK
jgi:hypothetical protein